MTCTDDPKHERFADWAPAFLFTLLGFIAGTIFGSVAASCMVTL